jgi:D-3-phosphoglycerate dehydrogenase
MVDVFSYHGARIAAQYLQTDAELGYSAIDTVGDLNSAEILVDLQKIPRTLRARFSQH